MVSTWKKQKFTNTTTAMPQVQVFNFMDVLVSLDKKQNALFTLKKNNFFKSLLQNNKNTVVEKTKNDLDVDELKNVVFVPSSRSISYKDNTSLLGNCKARLRPMR